MKNSQLLSILKKLSSIELREFQQYVEGLYPNRKQQQQLLKYLLSFYPNFESEQLTLKGMQQELFAAKSTRKKLLNILSDLKLLAIEFLLWKQRKKNSFEQALSLIQLLYDRGMDKVAEAEFKKLTKAMTRQKPSSPLHSYQLSSFKYFQLSTENSSDALRLTALDQSLKQLNSFYLINACKLFCEMLNRRNVYKETLIADIKILEQILASNLRREQNHLLSCYEKALRMNLYQSEEAYKELCKLYVINYSSFDPEDQLSLLLYLINFCIPRVMQGIPGYEITVLELHKLGFSAKILLFNNRLSKTVFLNTVTIGCRLGVLDWVDKIIEENAKYLEVSHREQTGKIAKALVAFNKEKYDKALICLNSISVSKDLDNSLRIRGLVTLCLFEKKAISVLLAQLKSFESFLKNNSKKISDGVRERYQRFINIMRLFLKQPINKSKIIALLNEPTAIFAKSFLLSKIKDVNL